MLLPHLGPWIGAVAGLRVVVAAYALFAAWRFRANLWHAVRERVDARPGDALCAFISVISLGVFVLSVYGLTFVAKQGHTPTDLHLWSRTMATTAYLICAFAYTMLITGVTTRASGRAEGIKAFWRVNHITFAMMTVGAFL